MFAITNFNTYGDFQKFAMDKLGISGFQFHQWEQLQNRLYLNPSASMTIEGVSPDGSMTPYILEENEMRVTAIDIFSRLMKDRIIWIAGPVTDVMSSVVQAQLMYLDIYNDSGKDIILHIDSPGGSVKAGLGMVDVMDYIKTDISTINVGLAASMGSVLLGKGTKGKRYSLPNSRTMLHQSSGGAVGQIIDAEIQMEQWKKYNQLLFEILGECCGKTAKQVIKDCNRDNWLDAKEAADYGIIDGVIKKRK